MNNISTTTQSSPAEAQEVLGHGRHRGTVSAEDNEVASHGRHRKPSGPRSKQTGTAA